MMRCMSANSRSNSRAIASRAARPVRFAIAILLLAPTLLPADRRFAPADRPDPIASPRAVPGGRIRTFAGGVPKSFNYFLDNNSFTAQVFGMLFESSE